MNRIKKLAEKKKNGICYECDDPAKPNRVRCVKHLNSNSNNVVKYRSTESGKDVKRKIDRNAKQKARRGYGRYSYVKGHVKRKGRTWKLSKKRYHSLIDNPCYYCELPNDVEAGSGLDRLDNNKGYVVGNVVSCCSLCNMARGDRLTVEEMKILGKAMKKIRLNRIKQ